MSNSLFRKKSVQRILFDAEGASGPRLVRALGVRDLAALGIAAIVGAGIFGTIGEAAAGGGPAVVFLFIFTAVACAFSALCYAEFASALPVAGSAYTYAYVAFGEIVAWIIGWDLIVEYAIGNIVVAISWSDYFTGLLNSFGWDFPPWLSLDYLSAWRGYPEAEALLAGGATVEQLPHALREAWLAWGTAPQLGSLRLIADLPALAIVFLITALVYVGIRESRTTSNVLVGLKLLTVVFVIVVGAFLVNPDNWSPFAPNGFAGVMKGVAAVFFAYIGFDALSTTAEECKNPQRDLPRAIILCLVICTILYILIALVLTGMASYDTLAVGDPLAFAFTQTGLDPEWAARISGVIAVSAIVAMTSVLLVFQMGQPRIWMSMSRDGLLPARFGRIHPRFRTPAFATIVTGFVVAIPALFMNLSEVTDLSSIGTLFAFVLVCGGVIRLQEKPGEYAPKFKIPYVDARWWVLGLFVAVWLGLFIWNSDGLSSFFSFSDAGKTAGAAFMRRVPMLVFIIGGTIACVLAFLRRWSLIPVLGLLCCFYLMSEVHYASWFRFVIWLAAGLVVYFLFGRRNSRLNPRNA